MECHGGNVRVGQNRRDEPQKKSFWLVEPIFQAPIYGPSSTTNNDEATANGQDLVIKVRSRQGWNILSLMLSMNLYSIYEHNGVLDPDILHDR